VPLLLAALAGAVYRSSVFSQFVPIRLDVVDAERHSTQHAVKITLPDLSTLRGQTAVLALRLRNTRPEQRQIGLMRDGFPTNRIVLPPDGAIRRDIVLSRETVRALATDGELARTLELTGDACAWATV
jgi:hypothetical protein